MRTLTVIQLILFAALIALLIVAFSIAPSKGDEKLPQSAPWHSFQVISREPIRVGCDNPTITAELVSPVENWRAVYDLPGGWKPYIVLPGTVKRHGRPDEQIEATIHVHCPEELNGGGYRDGKFAYLKDVAQ